MIRFLCTIFKIPYETCKSCETLKEELRFQREENKRLTDVLVEISSPKRIETVQQFVTPAANHPTLFSRRREELEAAERVKARALGGPLVAKSDKDLVGKIDSFKNDNPKPLGNQQSVEQLEQELGVVETNGK